MFCGHRFFRGNHSEKLGDRQMRWHLSRRLCNCNTAKPYPMNCAWIRSWSKVHVLFPLCYLLACPCSSTLKLLSLLWMKFFMDISYPNIPGTILRITWGCAASNISRHLNTYHNKHCPCHHAWISMFRHLGVLRQSLLPARHCSKKLKRKQAVAEGRLSPTVWMNVMKSDQILIQSHSPREKMQQQESWNKDKQSIATHIYMIYIYILYIYYYHI